MFKSAKKAEDVVCYMDGQEVFYHNLNGLIGLSVDGVTCAKAVKNYSPAIPNVQMIDLKLNVGGGPDEDGLYASLPILVKNIRRGNTLLSIENEDGVFQKYSFGRKGLEKFFDMRYEYISPEDRYNDKCLSDPIYHMEKNFILAGAFKALLGGFEVEILKTLKANGENVQVSYNLDTESWVVCSKNVALIAKSADQIDLYKGDRYSFAREMAHVWFDKLKELEGKGHQLEQLKKDLNSMTLVGEYVGSQEHQHLVKYSRVTIIFYAMVDNYSNDTCIPCDQAWAFFGKYGIDKGIIESIGKFTNYDQMCDKMCTVFKDVAKSEIAKDEEGNVLYFTKRDLSGKLPTQVMSLCKLKTLEYRLFRKMREKLRNYYARGSGEE
jgi:hypothetical protein